MPTLKQKAVFDKIAENHGNLSKTMREVGYSDITAEKPSNLTESKGWKQLMEEHLPDELLARKHKALLEKIDKEGEIDVTAVSKGLDMAYKLKGKNAPDRVINVNIDMVSEDDLLLAQQLEQRRIQTASVTSNGIDTSIVDRETQD